MSLKPILPGNLLQVPSGGTGPVILSGPVVNVPGHGWFSNLNGLVNISSGAPVNIIPPALDNLNPNVGDTITCSTGTWTGSPVGYKYQWWQFPNTVLLFETTNQFTPQAGDVGQRFYCQVEAEFPMGVFNNPTNSNVTNPVAGGFVPTDIAGCMLWLPVDAGGLGPVQLWADSSGNGNDALQGTLANRPTGNAVVLNGHNVVQFNGSTTFMQTPAFAAGQPNTIFIVLKMDTTSPANFICDGVGGANRNIFWDPGGNRALYAGSVVSGSAATTSPEIWCGVFNGASSNLWINGILDASGDPGAQNLTNGLNIGSAGDSPPNGALNGYIAEVIIYNTSLSDADKNRVGNYQSGWSGIPWTNI